MTHSQTAEPTLSDQHFQMPPEWAPHTATWMAWPHNADTWPKNLPQARLEYLQLLSAIAKDEPVFLLAGKKHAGEVSTTVRELPHFLSSNIHICPIETNDAWARDYAPTFVVHRKTAQIAAIDWQYNAWGGKYPPYDDDQRAAKFIADMIARQPQPEGGCRYTAKELFLEGGAIEVNEHGLLLCTCSCAMNRNRNPNLSERDISEILQSTLGVKHIIWLPGDAIIGDDTDGHIDQLARFTPSQTILYASPFSDEDSQRADLERNHFELQTGLAQWAPHIELLALPLPYPVEYDGQRIPASYCNFYITNRSVFVPQFDDPSDHLALEIIGSQFPDRRIVGLPSRNISVGLGSFHCLTQQQPVVSRTAARAN